MDTAEARVDWPVPAQEVRGPRGGLLAWLECQLVLGFVGRVARLPAGLRSAFVGALARGAPRLRESRGMRLIPRRGALEFVPAIVRAGGTVALLLDQRARVKPVLAPFFGREAKCDRSASVLVRRLRAPLVFAACYRTAQPG